MTCRLAASGTYPGGREGLSARSGLRASAGPEGRAWDSRVHFFSLQAGEIPGFSS